MSTPLRHQNASQLAKKPDFRPLLQDEAPYFNNLNRGPKDAYDFANSINNILSYGGFVSRVQSTLPNTDFTLYTIVKLSDSETIAAAVSDVDSYTGRYGIIVTEKDSEGYYIVCTYSPNFVFPSFITLSQLPGTPVYFDETSTLPYLVSSSNGISGTIGNVAIAKVTGAHSIFFSGTIRFS